MKNIKVHPFSSAFIPFTLLVLLLLTCCTNGHHELHHHGAEGHQPSSGETFSSCGGRTSAKVQSAYRYPPLLKLYTRIGDSENQKPFHYSSQDQYNKNPYGRATALRLNSSSVEVTIECEAPYPIDLTFDGHLTNREFKVDIKRTSNPGNTSCFLITARSSTSERMTGNFTCFSVENPRLGSSFYLYVTPPFDGYLLLRGQKFKVKVGVTQRNVTLPCPTSNHLAEVQLWKKDKRNIHQEELAETDKEAWKWTKLEPSKTVRYDPKIGWILPVNPGVFGVYQCTSNGEDNVTITVEDDGYQVSPALFNVPLSINESFSANCTARQEVQLEFHGTKFQFQEKINVNKNPGALDKKTGETLGFSSIGIKTEPLAENQITGSVSCQMKVNGTNVEIHRWKLERRKTGQNETHEVNSLRTSLFSKCGRDLDAIKVFECSNWVECRMRRCQQYDQNCRTIEFCIDDEAYLAVGKGKCPKNVIYQCVPQYYSSSLSMTMMIYFAGLKTRQITDSTAVPQDEILDLTEIEFKENTVTFACHGSAFVFARLFHWTVTYRGETKNSPDIIQHIPMENVTHAFSKSSIGIITSEIRLDNLYNIKEVNCTAPLWNSTEIITVTKSYAPHHMESQKNETNSLAEKVKPKNETNSLAQKVKPKNGVSSFLNTSKWMIILLSLFNYLFFL